MFNGDIEGRPSLGVYLGNDMEIFLDENAGDEYRRAGLDAREVRGYAVDSLPDKERIAREV